MVYGSARDILNGYSETSSVKEIVEFDEALLAIVAEAVRQAGEAVKSHIEKQASLTYALLDVYRKRIDKLEAISDGLEEKTELLDVEEIEHQLRQNNIRVSSAHARIKQADNSIAELFGDIHDLSTFGDGLASRIAALEQPERVGAWLLHNSKNKNDGLWYCNCVFHKSHRAEMRRHISSTCKCETCNTRRPEPVTEAVTYGTWQGDKGDIWTCDCTGILGHNSPADPETCIYCGCRQPERVKKYGRWTSPPAVAWHCRCDGNTVNVGERCELCDHWRPEGEPERVEVGHWKVWHCGCGCGHPKLISECPSCGDYRPPMEVTND